jgi:hypothetical protein
MKLTFCATFLLFTMSAAAQNTGEFDIFELTPGLAGALAESLDSSYLEYFTAACSGRSTKEAERHTGGQALSHKGT